MERLTNTRRPSGFSCRGLRIWGLLMILAGIVGRGLLQNRYLGLGTVTNEQLMALLDASGSGMAIATLSLVLQLLEACAVPVFAYLLVTGVQHTSDLKKYALRVAVLAVASELPYNLAFGGKLVGYSAQNPVFGLLLALVMVVFFRQYEGKTFKLLAIKVLVAVMGLVWARMLQVDHGTCTILIVTALWFTRSKPMMQNLFGAAAAMLCCSVNIFYMASPMVFLAIHFCNGEQGESSRAVNYLAYPAMLVAAAVAGIYLF